MGLLAFRPSSPNLVMMQDALCMIVCHPIESELAFVSTATLAVGYFAVAETATIFGFEERTFPTITWTLSHYISFVNIASAMRSAFSARPAMQINSRAMFADFANIEIT